MKTGTKVTTLLVVGLTALITGVVIAKRQKRAKEEESRQEESPRDENIIIFSTSERSIEVVRRPSSRELRPREIGRLKSLADYSRFQAFNSRKNAEVFRNSDLSVEDLRRIWDKARRDSLKSDEIYSFVQEEYIRRTVEQASEVLERE